MKESVSKSSRPRANSYPPQTDHHRRPSQTTDTSSFSPDFSSPTSSESDDSSDEEDPNSPQDTGIESVLTCKLPVDLTRSKAREFFKTHFDLRSAQMEFERIVSSTKSLSPKAFLDSMVARVPESYEVNFRDFKDSHIARLSIKEGTLKLEDEILSALAGVGQSALAEGFGGMDKLYRKRFVGPPWSLAPRFIRNLLIAAVHAAQQQIERFQISSSSENTLTSSKPSFPTIHENFKFGMTKVANESVANELEALFVGGEIDWAIVLVSENERQLNATEGAAKIEFAPSRVVAAIVEADDLESFSPTHNHHVLSVAIAGCKVSPNHIFPAFLSDGNRWDCYVVKEENGSMGVYSGISLDVRGEKERDTLVGLVASFVANPGEVPKGLSLV